MAKKPPNYTQKTVDWARKVEGWEIGITEKWVPSSISRNIVTAAMKGDMAMARAQANTMKRTKQFGVRQDLFGFIDCIAMTGEELVAIQSTSYGCVSARVNKIKTECVEHARKWVESGGRIEVWGWKEHERADHTRRRWRPRIVDFTLD